MNERIRALAEQADAYSDAMDIGGKNYMGLRDEYFAELIVKETINEMCELHCETIDRLKHSIREAMYLLDQPEPRSHAAFSELLCALNPKLRQIQENMDK